MRLSNLSHKELQDYVHHLEERMDVEFEKNGKSEAFWDLQDRLDLAHQELDFREAEDWND